MRALLFSIVGAQLVCHAPRTGLNIFEMSKVTLTNCNDSNFNDKGPVNLPNLVGPALADRPLPPPPRHLRLLQRRHLHRPGWINRAFFSKVEERFQKLGRKNFSFAFLPMHPYEKKKIVFGRLAHLPTLEHK